MVDGREDRSGSMIIPILAPTGRDARLISDLLESEGLGSVVCATSDELLRWIQADSGPPIIEEEGLDLETARRLAEWISDQPEWSDLPILVFRSVGRRRALEGVGLGHRVTYVDRPLRVALFAGIVRTASEVRQRQFEIRDLLEAQRRLTTQLDRRADRLQRLAFELTAAEQRERTRIAGILHNELQQLLVAATYRLSVPAGMLEEPQAISTVLEETNDIISSAINIARNLSHDLSPAVLRHGTLADTMAWLAEHAQTNYGLTVQVRNEPIASPVADALAIFLYQAVRELLFNAVKHAQAESAEIRLSEAEGRISIAVSDDGCGFDPASVLSLETDHTGLGLLSIRERLDLLGGELTIESAPGSGSSFVISAPCADFGPNGTRVGAAPGRGAFKGAEIGAPGGVTATSVVRVVVADDHEIFRKGVVSMLQRLSGVEVVGEARDGLEAVEVVAAVRPDVVLMDVSMPELDGIAATRAIEAMNTEVRVIALSMSSDHALQEQMRKSGASAYFSKSDDVSRLIDVILKGR